MIDLSQLDENTSGWVVQVTLQPPSLADNSADADRLLRALKHELGVDQIHVDLALLRQLPQILRRRTIRCAAFFSRSADAVC